MKYRKIDSNYVIKMDKGDEIVKEIIVEANLIKSSVALLK